MKYKNSQNKKEERTKSQTMVGGDSRVGQDEQVFDGKELPVGLSKI